MSVKYIFTLFKLSHTVESLLTTSTTATATIATATL